MKSLLLSTFVTVSFSASAYALDSLSQDDLSDAVLTDYETHLLPLFQHFHQNPELSHQEFKTATRLANELSDAGYHVTRNVGGTGVVATLKNGEGPLVMMRADMDALPIKEQTGLPYASNITQVNNLTGETVPVMHACGHDVHVTNLVGTARQMARLRKHWSGTLMLIGQPAEETDSGARGMMQDNLWQRFGRPDYALAMHVLSDNKAGTIDVIDGAPGAGSDSVEITVYGVGTHGAEPHMGKDPIVLASQIVLALQTLVSRELAPREPGVITVGAFNAGAKNNIIPEAAHLKLTVRNTNLETRQKLLDGIKRITINMARAAGMPDDKLPDIVFSREMTPPMVNNSGLAQRLKKVWQTKLGQEVVTSIKPQGMGAEDFPYFTTEPYIPSVYFMVGGTPQEFFDGKRAI
ncbi:MAG: amidohydrolase, partial [Kordiimonas sp.]